MPGTECCTLQNSIAQVDPPSCRRSWLTSVGSGKGRPFLSLRPAAAPPPPAGASRATMAVLPLDYVPAARVIQMV